MGPITSLPALGTLTSQAGNLFPRLGQLLPLHAGTDPFQIKSGGRHATAAPAGRAGTAGNPRRNDPSKRKDSESNM